ncbi:hypothetical protein QL093DRAFT_2370967 [Fusarium oxysporum]|nr:hypothetical protein QL093DRAFT_2370967 [Fusarium oxysporum]
MILSKAIFGFCLFFLFFFLFFSYRNSRHLCQVEFLISALSFSYFYPSLSLLIILIPLFLYIFFIAIL